MSGYSFSIFLKDFASSSLNKISTGLSQLQSKVTASQSNIQKNVGKTAFSINSSYGISRITNRMEMMNTQQYLDMRRQGYANDGITKYPSKAYDVNGVWS
jgi:hypothetical protein